jgi:hypothetical protein
VIAYVDYTQSGNIITPNLTVTDFLNFSWSPSASNPLGGATFDGSTLTPSFTVVKDGSYAFTLTATDLYGNESTFVFNFSYAAPVTPEATDTFSGVGTTTQTPSVLGDQTDTDQAVSGTSDVKTPASNNNGNIFGLAWYWWILIIAALVAAGWWLIAALRRRQQQDS